MLFPMLNVLHFHISAARTVRELSSVAVFCSSLISCFPPMLIRFIIIIIIICMSILSKYPSYRDHYIHKLHHGLFNSRLFIRIANWKLIPSVRILKSGCDILNSMLIT